MTDAEQLNEMIASEGMMHLSIRAASWYGFATACERYAQAAWNKIVQLSLKQTEDLMSLFQSNQEKFWIELKGFVQDFNAQAA